MSPGDIILIDFLSLIYANRNQSPFLSSGNLLGSDILDDIQKQEDMLQQCADQLANSEAIRVALVSQLKEAIEDQVGYASFCPPYDISCSIRYGSV